MVFVKESARGNAEQQIIPGHAAPDRHPPLHVAGKIIPMHVVVGRVL
jgi:hypothetical protein